LFRIVSDFGFRISNLLRIRGFGSSIAGFKFIGYAITQSALTPALSHRMGEGGCSPVL
jgi:hypothetical protein